MDSILNMPGSGGYEAGQETIQNTSFLNLWTNEGDRKAVHMTFDATDLNPQTSYSCLVCHSKDAGILGGSATAFDLAAIGTNLTDEHPIGMDMPSVDFNSPSGVRSNIEWFDTDGDSRPDTDEIRLYNTGSGARVECASCHDPHGVSPSGYGGTINPTFLRISNNGSAVCLTCHIK